MMNKHKKLDASLRTISNENAIHKRNFDYSPKKKKGLKKAPSVRRQK